MRGHNKGDQTVLIWRQKPRERSAWKPRRKCLMGGVATRLGSFADVWAGRQKPPRDTEIWQSDPDASHVSEEGVTILFSNQDRTVLTEKWVAGKEECHPWICPGDRKGSGGKIISNKLKLQ